MRNFILFFLSILPICWPGSLVAGESSLTPPLFNEARFYLRSRTSYYYTENNFISQSRSESLRESLQLKEGLSPFFHFMKTGWGLGWSPFTYLSSEAFLEGFWFAQSGSGTNLYFLSPALKRAGGTLRSPWLIKEVFGLIPEISFSYPFFSINYHTHVPVTDDGVWHFTPTLWLYGVLFNIVRPFVQAGLKWRGQPLSSLFQWKAGLMLRADVAEMGFYSHGFWPVTQDLSSSVLGDRVQLLKRVNAGSFRFFSSNPNMMGGTGWLAWHFPYLTLRLSGSIDLMGSRYSKGYGALAEIIVRMGKVRKTRVESLFSPADFTPEGKTTHLESAFENMKEDRVDEEDIEKMFNENEFMEEQRMEESSDP